MSKYVCSVCGYVHEGDQPPKECPQCKAPASKFVEQGPEMSWAAEHVVGVAQGAPEDIMEDLRANFNGECTEVGMYLAMSRVDFGKGRGNGARPFSAVPLELVVRERQGRAICCRGLCRPLSPLYEVGYDALDEL